MEAQLDVTVTHVSVIKWLTSIQHWCLLGWVSSAKSPHHMISNMTGRHRGPKEKLRVGYRGSSLKRTSHVGMHFHRQVWYCALCLRYRKFRHHPHLLDYLCAKVCFCRSLHCWASAWRKITYSITQSCSLFDAPGTELYCVFSKHVAHVHWTSSINKPVHWRTLTEQSAVA